MSSCIVCIKRNRAQQNSYFATDVGKQKRKVSNATDASKEAKKAYKESAEGKVKLKEYTSSDKYLQKCRDFAKTAAGKSIRKKTYDKNKLSSSLMNGVARILRGGNSPKTIACIGFSTEASFRDHIAAKISCTDMTFANYGIEWGCEHKIPRSAYNHDDLDDVKRCWSPENIHAMKHKGNKTKWTHLLREFIDEVPPTKWPVSWGGVVPGSCV
tara:strand:+ start:170 stop:808 length:639 start_codon:yes stop_codon:yes gene_type:complete